MAATGETSYISAEAYKRASLPLKYLGVAVPGIDQVDQFIRETYDPAAQRQLAEKSLGMGLLLVPSVDDGGQPGHGLRRLGGQLDQSAQLGLAEPFADRAPKLAISADTHQAIGRATVHQTPTLDGVEVLFFSDNPAAIPRGRFAGKQALASTAYVIEQVSRALSAEPLLDSGAAKTRTIFSGEGIVPIDVNVYEVLSAHSVGTTVTMASAGIPFDRGIKYIDRNVLGPAHKHVAGNHSHSLLD